MSFWDRLVEELRALAEVLVEWTVLIVAALIVLVIGRWIVKWIRKIVEKLLGGPRLQSVWDRSGVSRALDGSDQTVASIAGTLVYAYLMVGLVLVAARILQLTTIEDLLTRLLTWLPVLLVAAVIIIIAAAIASWSADLVRPFAEDRGVRWLTWVVHIAVVVFGVLFALDLLEINFAEDVVKILVFASGIGLAIAFGVGGIDTAKLWWAKYGAPSNPSTPTSREPTYGEDSQRDG